MPEFLVASVLIGVPLIVLGYILKRYQLVEIIAGYDQKKTLDKEGLVNWVGGNLIFIGIVSMVLGVLPFFVPLTTLQMIAGYIAVIFFLLIRAVLGTRKYETR